MYAKVKNKNGKVYYSPVLALAYDSWKSWAVVFDETLEKLVKIKLWSKNGLSFLFVDYNLENYEVVTENLKSAWKDKADLNRCKRGVFTDEQLEKAKTFIKNEKSSGFIEIKSDDDLKALLESAEYFHDGNLINIHAFGDFTEFTFYTWGSYVKIKVAGNIESDFDAYDELLDTSAKIENGKICFDFNTFENDERHIYADKAWCKTFFEQKIEIKRLSDFIVKNKCVYLRENGKEYHINTENSIVLQSVREKTCEFVFEGEEIMYKVTFTTEDESLNDFLNALKQSGFEICTLDFTKMAEKTQEGKVIYRKSCKTAPKSMWIPSVLWLVLFLCLKLSFLDMKWSSFFILWLVPPLGGALITVAIELLTTYDNTYIFVCENGLVLTGESYRTIGYEQIKKVEKSSNGKRVVVFADKKIKLPDFGDCDELYNQICGCIKEFKQKKAAEQKNESAEEYT